MIDLERQLNTSSPLAVINLSLHDAAAIYHPLSATISILSSLINRFFESFSYFLLLVHRSRALNILSLQKRVYTYLNNSTKITIYKRLRFKYDLDISSLTVYRFSKYLLALSFSVAFLHTLPEDHIIIAVRNNHLAGP